MQEIITLTKEYQQHEKEQAIKCTGAEALLKCLIEEQVDTIFGYPGGAIMPVYDALYDYQDKIQHFLVRHEQGATHAAQGYARVTGKPGVCFATSGPGATNMITGLADAFIDSTPIICITGQVISKLLGSDAFQETDVVGISKPVSKWNYQITKASEIPEIMAKAFYIAKSGRPGPVLIDITKDAQVEECEFVYKPCEGIRSYKPHPVLSTEKIQQAADLINNAKKPFLVFGQGILLSKAHEELRAFIEKTGVPCGATLLGLSGLDSNHPLFTGMLGMHGNYAPNIKTNEADVLIAVGMRFDDRVTGDVSTYAKSAKVIHIEIDRAEINKIIHADVAVHADAKEALQELIKYVEPNQHSEWINEFHQAKEKEVEAVIENDLNPSDDQISMGEVINTISELTQGEAIVVSDVGQHQMITQRYYKYKNPSTSVTSGGLGTMGFALPAAIGAKIGNPDKEVVAVIGDGGFQMTLQELSTIYQYQVPIKIVILNNHFLGMVRQWQQLFFEKRYSFTEMVNPEFDKVAQSFGVEGRKITERSELRQNLKDMLEFKGPILLDIGVKKEDNVFPIVPSGQCISKIRLA